MVISIMLLLETLMRNKQGKNNIKQLARTGFTFSLLLITLITTAQSGKNNNIKDPLTVKSPTDSVYLNRSIRDTLKKKDSSTIIVDTFDIDKISKDSLEAPIDYSAKDSGVLDIPGKRFYLYGKAHAKYQTLDITAAVIEIDNQKQIARAYGAKDTSGITINNPVMKDDDMTSESDSMFYNFKTQKGLTKKTLTKQGEMFVYAERVKKVSANEYFASKGRFTTCNLDTPHFAFRTSKMKIVNNKWAYSGVTYPEFEGVPIPVGIPFGIFPLSKGRHSGLLAPTFSATQYFGLGLEGLGYYKVLNEYIDVTIRSNIYSYGGYKLNIIPSYRRRYRYNGGFDFTFQHSKFNFKGDPDYNATNTYSLVLNHSIDTKARPGTNFSASVNISSSKYNRLVADNPIANFTNRLTSSIQYSKSWQQGKYNLQMSATHSQDNQQHSFNINLPNINFNATTFFPFKKEERIGEEKWFEKIGLSYSGQLQNQLAFYDTLNYANTKSGSLLKHLLDTTQWGITHSIPLTLSLPSLGPIQIAPGISYNEKWFGQQNIRQWNPFTNKLDTIQKRGFFAAREINTSLNFQTAIFGTFNLKNKNLVAIRHTIRPSLGINYKPDLVKKFYYETQINTQGDKLLLSAFDGSPIGGFSPGTFGGMSFGINQQIEAKVKDKSDTSGKATKKIRLLDNFSITSSYNFFAPGDTCKLSDIVINLSTTLFDKINISANTSIVPYVQNKFGNRTRLYAWQGDKFKIGNINSGNLSISTSFQSKSKDDKKKKEEDEHKDDYYNPDEDIRQKEYIRNHPAEFTDFNIPWSINLAFNMSFSKQPKPDYSGFIATTQASLNVNGDFSLTPKWKMGGSGYLDMRKIKLEQFSMFVSRDMHCWQLSINVTPIGLYPSFSITINPKSTILRDLKINRTRSFQAIL